MGSLATDPPRGIYLPSKPTDSRSPCPMVNCFANHGYIPRSGRIVQKADFVTACNEIGLSITLQQLLSSPIFLEYHGANPQPEPSLLQKAWTALHNPWSIVGSKFGTRPPGQIDEKGNEYLDLEQLAAHGAVEHDISLSRRDFAQGDNLRPQADLISALLSCSSSSDKTYLTMADLAAHRKKRIETQRTENPKMQYGILEHEIACGEIALILKVLGDGEKVRTDFVKAVFEEERLPIKEGWVPRVWIGVGLIELKMTVEKIKGLIGDVEFKK